LLDTRQLEGRFKFGTTCSEKGEPGNGSAIPDPEVAMRVEVTAFELVGPRSIELTPRCIANLPGVATSHVTM